MQKLSLYWQCALMTNSCKCLQRVAISVHTNFFCSIVLSMKTRLGFNKMGCAAWLQQHRVDDIPWQWRSLLKLNCSLCKTWLVIPIMAFDLYFKCTESSCSAVGEANRAGSQAESWSCSERYNMRFCLITMERNHRHLLQHGVWNEVSR